MPANNPLGVPPHPSTSTPGRPNSNYNNPFNNPNSNSFNSNSNATSKPLLRPKSTLAPRSTTGSSNRNSILGRSNSPPPPSSTSNSNHPTLRTNNLTSGANSSNYANSISSGNTGMTRNGSAANIHALQHSKHNLNANSPKPEDLEKFGAICYDLYYLQDSNAAKAVDYTLQKLPSTFRAAYAKKMASVRQQYHLDESIRRRKEVEEALSNSLPNSKIVELLKISLQGGVIALRSSKARKSRYNLLKSFLSLHCNSGLPGTLPFIRSLYAVLYLQGLNPSKGGAGPRRVEWNIDVAVFTEASGGTWMKDSIEILKSVLGFEERIQESTTESYFDEDEEIPINSTSLSEEQPLASTSYSPTSNSTSSASNKPPPPTIPPHRPAPGSLRNRALSDPFLDPKDRTPTSLGPLSPPSPSSIPSNIINPTPSTPFLHDSSPNSSPENKRKSIIVQPTTSFIERSPKPQIRIFTTPSYLTNPEIHSLCSLFPNYITSKSKPTSTTKTNSTKKSTTTSTKLNSTTFVGVQDEESIIGFDDNNEISKIGHGEIKIGAQTRENGWTGTLFERFKIWIFSCFGRR